MALGLDLLATFLEEDALSLGAKLAASGLRGDERLVFVADTHTGPQAHGEQAKETERGLVLPCGPALELPRRTLLPLAATWDRSARNCPLAAWDKLALR